MGFAGLWESWQAPGGGLLETFCILTTAANSLMATIHDRMPVILPQDGYGTWLSRKLHDPLELARFYQPYPSDYLDAVRVSTFVNSPTHDSDECVRPLQQAE